ncbi:MAG TPA: RDD family protein [Candidatus Sulfotelmatobacter sp.]|nr:RDD family protein [Candidatus Sulfotelmatobacter sp.]
MASSQVSTPIAPTVVRQNTYASLGHRVAAHLIDALIALAIVFAGGFFMQWLHALGAWTVPTPPAGEADPLMLWRGLGAAAKAAVIVVFIVSMGPIYTGLFQASAWQASVGKRLLNIYVTDTAGRRLHLGRSLARSFAKDLFSVFYLGVVSVATIIAAPKKQALHDYATNTVVLNGRPEGSRPPEIWRIVAAFGIQFLWFVGTFLLVFRANS